MDFYCIEAFIDLPEFHVINQVIRPQQLDIGDFRKISYCAKPTVSLGVTSAMVSSCGHDCGQIEPLVAQ